MRATLRRPKALSVEVLAGVVTTLALIPEVISFSIIAGVDPKVSLIASVVLASSMSFLGGRSHDHRGRRRRGPRGRAARE